MYRAYGSFSCNGLKSVVTIQIEATPLLPQRSVSKIPAAFIMLNSEQNVEVSDTTGDDSSNAAGTKK